MRIASLPLAAQSLAAPPRKALKPQQPLNSGDLVTLSSSDAVTTGGPRVGSWASRGLILALAVTTALSGTAAMANGLPSRVDMMTASGQMHPPIAGGGLKWDLSPNDVRQSTANSVTQDQIKSGEPQYQAAEPGQMTKHYYKAGIESAIQQARDNGTLTPANLAELMSRFESKDGGETVRSGTMFRYCVSQNPKTLACNAAVPNQLSYKILSCQYEGADGKLATVIHRNLEHQYTPSMHRAVCGGHRLEADRSSGFTMWHPVQVTTSGAPLYLNPSHILAVLPN